MFFAVVITGSNPSPPPPVADIGKALPATEGEEKKVAIMAVLADGVGGSMTTTKSVSLLRLFLETAQTHRCNKCSVPLLLFSAVK